MKTVLAPWLLLAALAWPTISEFGEARRWMDQGRPEQAVRTLEKLAQRKPGDPWVIYNLAVASYAAKDFRRADDLWQDLAGMSLPDALKDLVWFQIGNAAYRLAEPQIVAAPDRSLASLEESREAYRVALAQNTRHAAATENLAFVEKRLEDVYTGLALRLITAAEAEADPEKAIEKLFSAQRYQKGATALDPDSEAHRATEDRIRELLAQNYTRLAEAAEEQADARLKLGSNKDEERRKARSEYEAALKAVQQALSIREDYAPARTAQERVQTKLADLLAQSGRREQRAGDQDAKRKEPEKALEHYESALQHFESALQVQSQHADALAGRDEVREAMKTLHLAEGDRRLAAGEKQIKSDPEEATELLLKALNHFEQAKTLDPDDPSIQERIDRVNELLPDALSGFGKMDQERAAEAEPESIPRAIAYLERAESSYTRALQLNPQHEPAKQGLEEVQKELERLRKKLPKQPEEEKSSGAKARSARERLSSMLEKLRNAQKGEGSGSAQGARAGSQGAGSYRDW